MILPKQSLLALAVSCALTTPALAQENNNSETERGELETITVSSQKRVQSIQEVPLSVATLNGDEFENIFSAGDDILALAVRVPGLYAESSNGRVAPRFYMRGLGNADFDLAASQPVSVVMDDVVMENVVLKSFPLFDVQQVEIIRGPQGTLFGRNTTAGIVKIDTVKPDEDFDAYVKSSFGSFGTFNLEGAVGGALSDDLFGRVSVLRQHRDDYIDNAASSDSSKDIGGFTELAFRGQLLYQPSDDLSVLFQLQKRDLEGTASIFRANIFTKGSNELNENYDRDVVYYDGNLLGNGFDNNPQEYEGLGATLKVDYDLGDMTLTSVTSKQTAEGFSLGDIDGGFGSGDTSKPGFIPFGAVTRDNLNDLKQFTQEVRLASNDAGDGSWQVGFFYFDASFNVTSTDGTFGATTVFHDNTTWAVFGQTTYDLSDKVSLTGGLRYTRDEKNLEVGPQHVGGFCLLVDFIACDDSPVAPIDASDGRWSYDATVRYEVDEKTSVYARYANGFRAPTIQGRDVAFNGNPSVADSEVINSFEVGLKSDMMDNKLRINAAAFYYKIDDMQFTAIGGGANNVALINADNGRGYGFEIDARYIFNENLDFTVGYSYNDTEIQDPSLTVLPCGANPAFGSTGNCRVTDQRINTYFASIDGNPFPQSPETILTFTARYAVPMGDDGEFFVLTDWAFQGETNLFLYESREYVVDDQFEGGLRIGYENFADNYTISLFARNITDEDNVKGGIDFNNLTGFVNEPRVIGIEGKISFY